MTGTVSATGSEPSAAPLDVRTLICHRDVALGLRCLPTLLTFSEEPIRLTLHDDGTLDADDVARIHGAIPGARVLTRAEADERMSVVLRRHPFSAEFRRTHPFALKLLDTILTADMCFRPHRGLFDLPEGTDAIFMADTHDAYAWRSWQMLKRGVRLVERSNAGLMAFRVDRFDLDRAEWVLRQPIVPRFRHFAEQTAWAVLAAPLTVRQWAPSQVRIVAAGVRQPEGLVAGHYIGAFRHLLDEVTDASFASPSTPAVTVQTRPARTIGPAELARREIRRWLAGRLGRGRAQGYDAYAQEP
jgi:hypothetical protein